MSRTGFSRIGYPFLVAGLALGTATIAQSQSGQSGTTDAQVEANVLRALAGAPELSTQNIQSSTVYGTVTLTGNVHDEAMRTKAENLVARAVGVKKVVDELSLGDAAAPADQASASDQSAPQQPNCQLQSDGSCAPAPAAPAPAEQADNIPPTSPTGQQQPLLRSAGLSPTPLRSRRTAASIPEATALPRTRFLTTSPQISSTPVPTRSNTLNRRSSTLHSRRQSATAPRSSRERNNILNRRRPSNTRNRASPSSPTELPPASSTPAVMARRSSRIRRRPIPAASLSPMASRSRTINPTDSSSNPTDRPSSPIRDSSPTVLPRSAALCITTVRSRLMLLREASRLASRSPSRPALCSASASTADWTPTTSSLATPFDGTVLNDVPADGAIAIPRGASVQGTVVDASKAGALSGRGELSLEINSVILGGLAYPLQTQLWEQRGRDKSGSTVNNAIGLGALGAIIWRHRRWRRGCSRRCGSRCRCRRRRLSRVPGRTRHRSAGGCHRLSACSPSPQSTKTVSEQEMARLSPTLPAPTRSSRPWRRYYSPYYGYYYAPYYGR